MMPQILFARIAAGGYKGAFDISSIDGVYRCEDDNGQTQSGDLLVNDSGTVFWDGDPVGGIDENDRWWTTGFTPTGTWHVKLDYVSGTNTYSSGAATGSWIAISTAPNWFFSVSSSGGPNLTEGDWNLKFSDDGGSTTYDSVNINIEHFERSP